MINRVECQHEDQIPNDSCKQTANQGELSATEDCIGVEVRDVK